MTTRLSKSKIMAGLQCPKRLWLEVYRPDLAEHSAEAERRFQAGHAVNDVARSLQAGGILIDAGDTERNLAETREHLEKGVRAPLFEATFQHQNVIVRTDILTRRRGRFDITEVKSAASVKPPYYPDCAVQAWVLAGAGLDVGHVWLSHIDTNFVYRGDGDYRGLFTDNDLTEEIAPYRAEVPSQVKRCCEVLEGPEPDVPVGDQCKTPYPCPFMNHCAPEQPEYPVTCLPYGGKTAKALLVEGITDIREIPDGRLTSATHEWVRSVTRSGQPDLRTDQLAPLRQLGFPRYYLDFETVGFAVPIWAGTGPYQQVPFQWSVHIEDAGGNLVHREFLDTTGENPVQRLAEALIATLGQDGPVIVYTGFEAARIREMAEALPVLRRPLRRILSRIFDLHPVVRQAYYHPDMLGSWSIKSVLPTIAPHLSYDRLGEVQDGIAAGEAYREMVHPQTPAERRAQLEADLRRYCGHDTLGMAEIVRFLAKSGNSRE